MIYINRLTGEKVQVRRNAMREYIMPDGSKITYHRFRKDYKLDKVASKPFRAKIIKETYVKTL